MSLDPSTQSQWFWLIGDMRVGQGDLDPGALSYEIPFSTHSAFVPVLFPGHHLGFERIVPADATIEVQPTQHADRDLYHVQPTDVLRRVVELRTMQQPVRFFGSEVLLERVHGLGEENVQNHFDDIRFSVIHVGKVTHATCELAGIAKVRQG